MKRKIMFPIMAALLLLSNGITASAAPEVIKVNGANTVFDAEYYASANPDVAAVIGTDRDTLLQHYMETGRVEKRPAYAPGTDIDAVLAAAGIQKKKVKLENRRTDGFSNSNTVSAAEYDEQGNPLSLTVDGYYAKTGAHAYNDVYTYTYDEHGNMLTKTQVSDGGRPITTRCAYTYDERGNMLSTTWLLTNGEPDYTVTYTYDGYDNVLSKTIVPQNGSPDQKGKIQTTTFTYAYDEYGNMLSQTSVDEHGQTWSQTYDKYGNMLINKGTIFSDSSMTAIETYTYTQTYNEHGDMVSLTYVTFDGNGTQTYDYSETYTYTYDGRGNILSKVGVNNKGRTSTANYTYDEYGNLLSEVLVGYTGTRDNNTYDGYGHPLSKTRVESDGRTPTEIYSYVYF